MRPQIVDNMVEGTGQVFQQSRRVVGIRSRMEPVRPEWKSSGFLYVGGCAQNQPQRIVIKAAANIMITLLGEG